MQGSKSLTLNSVLGKADMVNAITNQYVISPLVNLGLAGIELDVKEEESIKLRATITDHYLESGSSVQDHIAIAPLEITLKGYVGEAVVYSDAGKPPAMQNFAEKLTVLNSFLPIMTSGARGLQNKITSARSASRNNKLAASAKGITGGMVDLYSTYKQITPPSGRQAQKFNFLRALFYSKITVGLQTPWNYFPNMAIQGINFKKLHNEPLITEVEVSLKQLSFVETSNALSNKASDTIRAGQAVGTLKKGITQGRKLSDATKKAKDVPLISAAKKAKDAIFGNTKKLFGF